MYAIHTVHKCTPYRLEKAVCIYYTYYRLCIVYYMLYIIYQHQIKADRDHQAVHEGTVGGAGKASCSLAVPFLHVFGFLLNTADDRSPA